MKRAGYDGFKTHERINGIFHQWSNTEHGGRQTMLYFLTCLVHLQKKVLRDASHDVRGVSIRDVNVCVLLYADYARFGADESNDLW